MKDNTEKTSYIIGFRESNEERTKALFFVISLLRSYFPNLEIIVVEQDDKPKLQLDESLNVRQIFFQNPGVYNHSRAYNEGAKITDREILIFGCADIFLTKEAYLNCFDEIQNFEAVTPNRTALSNVLISNPEKHEFDFLSSRQLYTFAGGILFMTQESFKKSGGWDERFEGWGGDDLAMSHVIFNKLTSKSLCLAMYHIDHPRGISEGKEHKKYADNRKLTDEISTFHGATLDRYIDFLQIENGFKKGNLSNEKGKAKFVFAVTTFNRYDYFKNCLESFFKTRNSDVDWQIIVADDGSTDATPDYLQMLAKDHGAIIIQNKGTDIHRQVNTIFKKLEELDFDLCFRLDDDVVFIQKGWDDLYWEAIQRTGYDHLIYYDKHWQPHANLERPILAGGLVSNCTPEGVGGSLYTLTKRVLLEVGYYDEQLFGRRGLAHVDFSFRCCRMGFNVLANPFDVKGSSDFLRVQSEGGYSSSVSFAYKSKINPKEVIAFKKNLTRMERRYIPFNQNHFELIRTNSKKSHDSGQSFKKASTASRFRRADSTFYPDRGIGGLIGFIIKRFYNFGIDTRLYFIPASIKGLGRILNKLSMDLMSVDE